MVRGPDARRLVRRGADGARRSRGDRLVGGPPAAPEPADRSAERATRPASWPRSPVAPGSPAFREDTRELRMRIADEAEMLWDRKVSWGASLRTGRARFTTQSVAAMTRLRFDERAVLDTLIDAGVARSRSEALAWCVRLVGPPPERLDQPAARGDGPGRAGALGRPGPRLTSGSRPRCSGSGGRPTARSGRPRPPPRRGRRPDAIAVDGRGEVADQHRPGEDRPAEREPARQQRHRDQQGDQRRRAPPERQAEHRGRAGGDRAAGRARRCGPPSRAG